MPKVTAHQLTLAQSALGDIYANLEQTIFKMFVDRLTKKGVFDFDNDHVLQWQLEKLSDLNLINTQTVEEAAKATKIAEPKLRALFEDAGYAVAHAEYQNLAKVTGKTVPITITDQVLAGYLKQTFLELNNNVNQTLLSTNYQDNAAVKVYQQIIKETTAQVISGLKTPKQALASTIYKWRDKGIKTVLTDKSKHAWSLEAYARMVINTTSNRAFQAVRNQAAEDYGIDTFVMSSHAASRPACAPIQGKTVTTRSEGFTAPESGEWFEPLSNHGYGRPGGTFGINCGHMMWPYIPGVNTNHQEQYDPEEAVRKGNVTQNQRLLERRIRGYKNNLKLAEQLDDEKGMAKYQQLIRRNQACIRQLIKENEFLHRDYSREKGFGPSDREVRILRNRSTINIQKQNRHIPGKKEFVEERQKRYNKGRQKQSRLTISIGESQSLINKYGFHDLTTRSTTFTHDSYIGVFVDQKTGSEILTNRGIIKYSKTGAHIYPIDPERSD